MLNCLHANDHGFRPLSKEQILDAHWAVKGASREETDFDIKPGMDGRVLQISIAAATAGITEETTRRTEEFLRQDGFHLSVPAISSASDEHAS